MDAKTNGAMPATAFNENDPEGYYTTHYGLTKRELFAAMAMQGVMAMQSHPDVIAAVAGCAEKECKTTDEYIASNCVSLADALLAALARESTP